MEEFILTLEGDGFWCFMLIVFELSYGFWGWGLVLDTRLLLSGL